jgi:cytochrome c2
MLPYMNPVSGGIEIMKIDQIPNSGPQLQASTPAFLFAWNALALVLLVLLPAVTSRVPIWLALDADVLVVEVLAGAYLAGILILTVVQSRGRPVGITPAVGVTVAAFGVAFLILLMTRWATGFSRAILLVLFCSAIILAALGFVLHRFRTPSLAALALMVAAELGIELYRAYGPAQQLSMQKVASNISTSFYTVRAVTYKDAIPPTEVRGGGIALIGDQYLLATGDGRLYLFGWRQPSDSFSVRHLPYNVPLNSAEFAADANPHGYGAVPNSAAADQVQGVQTWQFRVADVFVQEQGERIRVFASHHYWKRAQQCFVVRVSSMAGTRAAFIAGDPALHWQTIFESTPCIPIRGEHSIRENNPFAGMEVGGRVLPLDDRTLLVTLGDHDFAGLASKEIFSQDPHASYGKTILIHLDDLSSEIYSMGHRNPQGLYVTAEGTVWSTEHGPQGGDELNLIVHGANYGWPLVTYGTDYGSATWPLNHHQGRHDGYQQPIYAWVPSIGVSNLIRIEQDRFPVWKGDLMVASLHAHTLFRIRLLDQRVVFAEPIEIGERIRDIREGLDGRLVLWTDTSRIISLTPAEGTDGAVLFATSCGGCHKVLNGLEHSYGPDLAGIVGRRVASAPGFEAYSPALKASHGKWTKERLDAWLSDPQTVAPGTTMTFRGIPDRAQRAAIIDYLEGTK